MQCKGSGTGVMMKDEIRFSGRDLAETQAKERRRRMEAARREGLGELTGKPLPLSAALARLTRAAMREAA